MWRKDDRDRYGELEVGASVSCDILASVIAMADDEWGWNFVRNVTLTRRMVVRGRGEKIIYRFLSLVGSLRLFLVRRRMTPFSRLGILPFPFPSLPIVMRVILTFHLLSPSLRLSFRDD